MKSLTATLLAPAAVAALLSAGPAAALDLSWSGYATLGYARTSVDGRYLRTIDRDGSFDAESVLAGQLDARLSPRWSATVQLKAALDDERDSRWALEPAWAFVAWRASDEWLLRAGRMRVPLYLHSESLDVGAAHDMARLPVEMYSIAPTNDFKGGFATYSTAVDWLEQGEFSLDAYGGSTRIVARLWIPRGVPGVVDAGASFRKLDVRVTGLAATLRSPRTTLRLALTNGLAGQTDGQPIATAYPFVSPAPGIGYYRVDESLPGPPIPTTDRIRNLVATVGFEHKLGPGVRLVGEYARNKQYRTELGSDTSGGYLAGFVDIGAFTPYASFGRLGTSAAQMDNYRRLVSQRVSPLVPGAAQIEAAQQLAATGIYVANQDTFALGSAWRTPWGGKLKLEWAQTRVYEASRLVDGPPDAPPLRDRRFDTWTVNYSLAF